MPIQYREVVTYAAASSLTGNGGTLRVVFADAAGQHADLYVASPQILAAAIAVLEIAKPAYVGFENGKHVVVSSTQGLPGEGG